MIIINSTCVLNDSLLLNLMSSHLHSDHTVYDKKTDYLQ